VVRLRRTSGVPDFTPHDLRSTAALLMGERGVRPDVIERVLNHTPAKIARTYNLAAYDAEKRQALAILGDPIADGRATGADTSVLRPGNAWDC
jgi:integrase